MNINQYDPSCTGLLPSPPDSPSMSRSRPNPKDAERDTLRSAPLSGRFTFRQTHGGVTDLANTPSQQSEARLSQLQTRVNQGRSCDPAVDSLREIATTPLSSTNDHERGTHPLSPDSATGRCSSNQKSRGNPSGASSFSSQFGHGGKSSKLPSPSDEEEEEEAISTESDAEDDAGTEKTGAELLAEKRKMKRFRSVHSIFCWVSWTNLA